MPYPRIDRDNAPPPPPRRRDPTLLAGLLPRLERLADDTWVLAQRAPSLAADPALVAAASAVLADLRELLHREPGVHLLPRRAFAGTIGLHALALALRQMQAALAAFIARRRPAGRTVAEEIDDINRITALYLRDMTHRVVDHARVPLPPDLQPEPEASAAPPPPGKPPAPKPHIRRAITRRRNPLRRTGRAQ